MTITSDDIMKALREVVAEQPDHVYCRPEHMSTRHACLYVHTSENGDRVPGCVVGHALERVGIPLVWMAQYEGSSAVGITAGLGIQVDAATGVFLNDVQMGQDAGQSWGEALTQAEEDRA